MINDKNVAGISADKPDRVAFAIDGRNQAINEEVHHTLRVGRDSGDAVVVGSAEVAGTLTATRGTGFRSNGTPIEGVALTPQGPRRLTPIEYERLMGYPDNYTLIEFHRGEPVTDGHRYRALGNSKPVTIVRWICECISNALEHPAQE